MFYVWMVNNMAQKKSPEEREMLINLVGEYFLQTGQSTREIAAYFTELGYPLSNATVFDYISKFKKKNPNAGSIIAEKIDENKVKSIEDVAVRTRVMYVTKFFLQNHTADEIALAFNVTTSVIYRDLNERLPIIEANHMKYFPKDRPLTGQTTKGFYEFFGTDEGESITSLVQEKLKENSIGNLQNRSHK